MVEWGLPRAHPSTKAVNTLAKSVRINFIRTQETDQKFTGAMQMLNKEITATPPSLSESVQILWSVYLPE